MGHAIHVTHFLFPQLRQLHEEEPQRTLKLLGAAEALREKIGSPMASYENWNIKNQVAQLRVTLPEAEFNALWTEGKSMTNEQAVQLALKGSND
jgi:hypothetical protein